MDDDYVYIDEDHRIGSGYDDSPENPRTWTTPVGFVTVEHRPRYIDVEPVYGDPTDSGIVRAHEHFDEIGYPKWDPNVGSQRRRRFFPEAEEITVRWARIFYDLTLVYDSEYQGYWFVDPDELQKNWLFQGSERIFWPTTDAALKGDRSEATMADPANWAAKEQVERDLIDGERKQYNAWANGNVYYVYGQKRLLTHTEFTEPDGSSVRVVDGEEWETEDSLSGIYPEDGDWLTEEDMLSVAREYFGDAYSPKVKKEEEV